MSTTERNEKYHLGNFIMDAMKHYKDRVAVVDAATGDSETNGSLLARSACLARCFLRAGFGTGDVLALGGRNHLDLHIPYYASLFTGIAIMGVDPMFKFNEIKHLFSIAKPKIAFCQQESLELYERAAEELGLHTRVVVFEDNCEKSMKKFIEEYEDKENKEEFQVCQFDPKHTVAWLVSTSGSTGFPKLAAFSHASLVKIFDIFSKMMSRPDGTCEVVLHISPVQWISSFFNALSMCWGNIRVQTSATHTLDHIINIINEYKPITVTISPTTLGLLLQRCREKPCDFTCFDTVVLVGSELHDHVAEDLRSRLREDGKVINAYGQTETLGPSLSPCINGPKGSVGRPSPLVKIKLVDPETGLEVTEPNVPGELWSIGARMMGYYNNPEMTKAAITEDGWYKTGDLLKRDENDNYYFVGRIKSLIKWRGFHVLPAELESVIKQVPGVVDAAVIGVPHEEEGERPLAVVVRQGKAEISAQDVKDAVSENFSSNKQLRGGVVFVKELPYTSTGKIARANLNDLIKNKTPE